MWNIGKIDGIPLVFITGVLSWIIFPLVNFYLGNLYIVQKFRSLVSDSMLSSCWRAICHRPLWANITGHNCVMIFLHIPFVFSKEHPNTFTLLVEYTLLIIIGPLFKGNSGSSAESWVIYKIETYIHFIGPLTWFLWWWWTEVVNVVKLRNSILK